MATIKDLTVQDIWNMYGGKKYAHFKQNDLDKFKAFLLDKGYTYTQPLPLDYYMLRDYKKAKQERNWKKIMRDYEAKLPKLEAASQALEEKLTQAKEGGVKAGAKVDNTVTVSKGHDEGYVQGRYHPVRDLRTGETIGYVPEGTTQEQFNTDQRFVDLRNKATTTTELGDISVAPGTEGKINVEKQGGGQVEVGMGDTGTTSADTSTTGTTGKGTLNDDVVIQDLRNQLKNLIIDTQERSDLDVAAKRKLTDAAIAATEDEINKRLAELKTQTQAELADEASIGAYTKQFVDPQVEKLRSILGEQATEEEKLIREGLASRGMLESGVYGEQLGKGEERRAKILGRESQDILTSALANRRADILGQAQQERARITGQEARKIARQIGLEESDIARIYGTESRDVGLGQQFYGEDYTSQLLSQQQQREDELLRGERAYQDKIREENYKRQLALQEALTSQRQQPSFIDTLLQGLAGTAGTVGGYIGGRGLYDLIYPNKRRV